MKIAITGTILRCAALAPAAALGLCVAGGLASCGALDVSDPTAIEESELNDAAGAQLLRGAVLKQLSQAVGDGAYLGGLLADEFLSDPPSWWNPPGTYPGELLDRRESARYEQQPATDVGYGKWLSLRRAATVAMPKLRAYAPVDAAEAKVGEMFTLRGYATLRLAEDFCSGFPLHDVVDGKIVYGSPLSTEEALAMALADFDSAVAYAVDSTRILNLARVGRARTLLGLGRFDEAGAAVAGVPTEYVTNVEYLASAGLGNRLAFGSPSFDMTWQSVADQEGGTGLDFVSAEDPRVLVDRLGTANDGVTGIYGIAKYATSDAPIVLGSGVEARLIEAEAALMRGDPNWLATLNFLRQSQVTPALADITDPGTAAAREDLLFRERAFWLFATGHRLGDLRRLVRFYGRSVESVFPTGAYRLGGAYATGTSIPFPAAREAPFNPAVTGCTSR